MFLKNLVKNSLQIVFSITLMLTFSFGLLVVSTNAQGTSPTPPAGGNTNSLIPGNSDICPNGNCPLGINPDNAPTSRSGISQFIINIASFITFIAVAVAVLFMVYGGVTYITAGTEDGNVKGKQILINATIGLVVAIVAYTIVSVIASIVNSDILTDVLPPSNT
jgi:hypothetical protein